MGKIKFYADATKIGMPFICINEGGFENAVMLIDTGSNNNILFGYVYEQVKDQLQEVKGDYVITGIDGETKKASAVVGNMPFCGKRYEMTFLVKDEGDPGPMLSKEIGIPVIGIIGTLFMAEHDWVLDFAKQEVLIPDTDVSVGEFRSVLSQRGTATCMTTLKRR